MSECLIVIDENIWAIDEDSPHASKINTNNSVKIVAQDDHEWLILTTTHDVFSLEPCTNNCIPVNINVPNKIIGIYVNQHTTLFLDAAGNVYGLGNLSSHVWEYLDNVYLDVKLPLKLDLGFQVSKIAMAGNHTVFLSVDDEIYGCGWSLVCDDLYPQFDKVSLQKIDLDFKVTQVVTQQYCGPAYISEEKKVYIGDKLLNIDNVQHICCTDRLIHFIDDNGKLYHVYFNNHKVRSVNLPYRVTELYGKNDSLLLLDEENNLHQRIYDMDSDKTISRKVIFNEPVCHIKLNNNHDNMRFKTTKSALF